MPHFPAELVGGTHEIHISGQRQHVPKRRWAPGAFRVHRPDKTAVSRSDIETIDSACGQLVKAVVAVSAVVQPERTLKLVQRQQSEVGRVGHVGVFRARFIPEGDGFLGHIDEPAYRRGAV